MSTPSAASPQDPMAVAPDLIIAKVSETDLGRALVERAYFALLAERLAGENRKLREAADTSTNSADADTDTTTSG